MRKLSLWMTVVILFLSISIYGAGIKDIIPVFKEMIVSIEEFIINMEKATDAKGVVFALDNYSKAMLKYAPAVKKLIIEHPELKDEKTHPEELKPYTKKIEELMKKMIKIYEKITMYKDEPQVRGAIKRWQKAMSSLDNKENQKEERGK